MHAAVTNPRFLDAFSRNGPIIVTNPRVLDMDVFVGIEGSAFIHLVDIGVVEQSALELPILMGF